MKKNEALQKNDSLECDAVLKRIARRELDAAFSFLEERSIPSQDIFTRAKGEEAAKRKFPAAFVLALVSILAAIAALAAVLVIVTFGEIGMDALIDREYLTASSTADQQQYQIRGNVVKSGIIAAGQAEDAQGDAILDDVAFEDLPGILGFDPPYPHWLPEGWEPEEFSATVSRFSSDVHMVYQKAGQRVLLRYTLMKYSDVEAASMGIEQDKTGDTRRWGDASVYLTTNGDSLIAVWLEDNVCYMLSGPISEEQMKEIFESIGTDE